MGQLEARDPGSGADDGRRSCISPPRRAAEIFVGGTQRLASVWEDLSAMQRVLEVLEREAEVMRILAGASGHLDSDRRPARWRRRPRRRVEDL